LSRASIRQECEDSLRRLQVDAIDLYQMHWPLPEGDIEEGWGAMAELVKEGKARYIGVSNFNAVQMERVRPIHPIASLQPPYSMLVRDVEDETLAYCARHQIGVVAYSPMQKGLLTGKVTPEWVASLPADDHRRKDARFNGAPLEATMQLVDGLRILASKYNISLAQLAVAWVLRRSEVTSAIVGARRPAQIEETVGAGDVVLKAEDIEAIGDLLAAHSRKTAEKA
jgi:aryl-alcohol dehydrogenase-like predicted oxidoreductase